MTVALRLVAFLLLALWLPATEHCHLEAAGLHPGAHTEETASSCADACRTDVCRSVEDASFTKDGATVRLLPPLTADLDVFFQVILALTRPDVPAVPAPDLLAPDLLALQRTWSFSHRTALPARAPDPLA